MKKNILKYFPLLTIFLSIILFSSCPVYIELTPTDTENVLFSFNTIADKSIKELIQSFDNSIDNNANQDFKIFDTVEIERGLLQIGFKNIFAFSVQENTGAESLKIKGTATNSDINFIKLYRDKNNQLTKIEFTLSPEILQNLILENNSIIQKYADLLMAPCFTNEDLEKDEYIEILSSLYGNEIAKSFTSGAIDIAIKNARTKKIISSVSIPILDLLTLTEEKKFTLNLL